MGVGRLIELLMESSRWSFISRLYSIDLLELWHVYMLGSTTLDMVWWRELPEDCFQYWRKDLKAFCLGCILSSSSSILWVFWAAAPFTIPHVSGFPFPFPSAWQLE